MYRKFVDLLTILPVDPQTKDKDVFYTLKPKLRMQAMCSASSCLHFPSASEGSYFMKQSSLADFVAGHAQQLRSRMMVVSAEFCQQRIK